MPTTSIKAPQRIIGLYSPSPGCGKTTAANFLQLQGYRSVSFAAPLRNMLLSLLLDLGYTSGSASNLLHEHKEQPLVGLGVSARHMLRTLGTEWGRQCIHPDIWLQSFQSRIAGLPLVVVDDVRFLNEAELIRRRGGEVWLLRRPGHEQASEHASDGGLNDWPHFTVTIENSGSLDDLKRQVLHHVAQSAAA